MIIGIFLKKKYNFLWFMNDFNFNHIENKNKLLKSIQLKLRK